MRARVLEQQLALDQRDQMLLQILDWYLSNLQNALVADLLVLVEKHKKKHLVWRGQELVFLGEIAT